jgi:hypothetical protein
MSEPSEAATGLAAGAVLTAAVAAGDMDAATPLFLGGGAGLVLALTPRARTTGIALVLASIAGAAYLGTRRRRAR